MCPTGQYRTMCTKHADSYCTLCTNKPAGNFVYTSPGNDNDCEYAACNTDPNAEPPLCDSATESVVVQGGSDGAFTSDSPTDLVFYAEIPLDEATFNSAGAAYKDALKNLTGAEVTIEKVEAIPAATFTRDHQHKAQLAVSRVNQRRQAEEAAEGKNESQRNESLRNESQCHAPLAPLNMNTCYQDMCTSYGGEVCVCVCARVLCVMHVYVHGVCLLCPLPCSPPPSLSHTFYLSHILSVPLTHPFPPSFYAASPPPYSDPPLPSHSTP